MITKQITHPRTLRMLAKAGHFDYVYGLRTVRDKAGKPWVFTHKKRRFCLGFKESNQFPSVFEHHA